LGVRTGALAVVLSITAAGCIIDTAPARPSAAALSHPTRTLVLDNGLRVVLEETPDFGAASVASGIGAGAADDPSGKGGLAHLVEHLVCQSAHGGASFWTGFLENRANAFTDWDETIYHAMTDLGALEQSLAIAYDAVLDPLGGVDDAIFQRQKRIVESEVRFHQVEQTPADEALWAAVFSPEHPYALPIGGTVASVAPLSWPDVTAFVDAHYQPSKGVLALVAPLRLDEQQKLVERVTGHSARLATPPPAPTAGAAPAVDLPASYSETTAPVASPRLLIGWSLPSTTKSEDLANLVSRMLHGLSFALHAHDPDVSSIESWVSNGARADLLTVRAILREGTHVDRTSALVIDEVQRGLGKLAGEFEGFQSMRAFYGSEALYEQENVTRQGIDAVWSTLRVGRPTFLAERGGRFLDLGADEVLRYVQTFLSPKRAHVVLIRPGEPPPNAAPPVALTPAVLHVPTAVPAGGAVVPTPPAPKPHPLLREVEQHVLSNGLQVVLFRRPGSTFHTVLLGLRGGRAQATPPGVIAAADWARQWDHQSPRIFGILHNEWADENDTIERLRGIGSNVDVTLGYLREQLGFSVLWPPKNFTDRVSLFERENQMPTERLSRQIAASLFGAEALGTEPTADQIQSVTPTQVNHWLSRVRQPSNAVLVIVGDFDTDATVRAAEKELGGWGANASPRPPPSDPPLMTELASPSDRIIYTNQPGATHATMRFECLLPKTTAQDWAARLLFQSSVYGSTLDELRENLGSTYSVWARTLVLRGGTTVLRMQTDVDYRLLPQALRWLRQNLMESGRGFPGQSQLATIKAAAVRRLQLDGATSTDWAEELLSEWTQGWPLDLPDQLPAAIGALGPESLAPLATHCQANSVIGLLGDEARLESAWTAASQSN
jgi:zinc protease